MTRSADALGLRAVRFCLAEPRLFQTQLRAILRASHHGNLRILLPMLSSIGEIAACMAAIDVAKEALRERGVAFDEAIEVGGMIEIPAAVLAIEAFAARLDFLSIGTNDLIQYTLAVDRADESVSHLYDPTHPAVLRLLAMAIGGAHRAGKPIAVCGEMAGDVDMTRLLLGLGLTHFSMHPAHLLQVQGQEAAFQLAQRGRELRPQTHGVLVAQVALHADALEGPARVARDPGADRGATAADARGRQPQPGRRAGQAGALRRRTLRHRRPRSALRRRLFGLAGLQAAARAANDAASRAQNQAASAAEAEAASKAAAQAASHGANDAASKASAQAASHAANQAALSATAQAKYVAASRAAADAASKAVAQAEALAKSQAASRTAADAASHAAAQAAMRADAAAKAQRGRANQRHVVEVDDVVAASLQHTPDLRLEQRTRRLLREQRRERAERRPHGRHADVGVIVEPLRRLAGIRPLCPDRQPAERSCTEATGQALRSPPPSYLPCTCPRRHRRRDRSAARCRAAARR